MQVNEDLNFKKKLCIFFHCSFLLDLGFCLTSWAVMLNYSMCYAKPNFKFFAYKTRSPNKILFPCLYF